MSYEESGSPRNLAEFGISRDVLTSQGYLVQWEDVIQSFDLGILFLFGALRAQRPESPIQKLDIDILKGIDFESLWNRDQISMFDYIKQLHIDKGYDEKEISETIKSCENEILTYIRNDETGVIFGASPKLIFLKCLMNIYNDRDTDSIIFVVDEMYCAASRTVPHAFLADLFPQDPNRPIYVDIRTKPFDEYVLDYKKEHPNDKIVIVTSTPKLLATSIDKNSVLKDVTIICPEFKAQDMVPGIFNFMNKIEYRNEYILYKQKPIAL